MATLREGLLAFDFPDDWQVIKYDDCPAYRRGLGQLDGSKAVDFLALEPRGSLYLIEVKDFRGHAIENRSRLRAQPGRPEEVSLFQEIGHKVRDSIAGIIGGSRMVGGEWPERFRPFIDHLIDSRRRIGVLAWIEEDNDPREGRARASTYTRSLERHVRWLTSYVLVANSAHNPLASAGLSRRSLPASG